MNDIGLKTFTRAKGTLFTDPKLTFYAALFARRAVTFTTKVQTAAVDAKGNMFFNLDFVATLTVQQAVFLICHELLHIVYMHPQRLGGRDPQRWNIAGDAVINDQQRHDKVGQWIDGGVDEPDARTKTADEMYSEIHDDHHGGGIGHDLIDGDGSHDPSNPASVTADEMSAVTAGIKTDIAAAAQEARIAGNMSAEMQSIVDSVLQVRTPWYEILERFITQRSKTDYSWSRPNRRTIANGGYMPTLDAVARVGTVLIGRDISLSIREEEHAAFNGHFNRIIETCVPEKVHVMYCDTDVQRHDVFESSDYPIKCESMYGGGTWLPAIFNKAKTLQDDIDVCIIFTDGYTEWPPIPQDYPVLIVCTTDTDVPYGDEIVRFNMND